ncbi:unnamed protein product [Rotaria socialis]|uniref:Uncharacterized protein n=1 Tax=Rotaria socialis TaxID=392032 RepID=A0A818J780_9BILA|nr:unnamed protein product [Rotaria socialis]
MQTSIYICFIAIAFMQLLAVSLSDVPDANVGAADPDAGAAAPDTVAVAPDTVGAAPVPVATAVDTAAAPPVVDIIAPNAAVVDETQ